MSSHRNLLNETIEKIKENGYHQRDVEWVGNRDGTLAITWKQFKKIADIEYDAGYGSEEIATDLVVVGSEWWLERHEYDGSEWWEFKTLPVKQGIPQTFNTVTVRDYTHELINLQKVTHNEQ